MTTKRSMIGVTYGEATGIGPELVAKALQSERIQSMATWVLIGDERIFINGSRTANAPISYQKCDDLSGIDPSAGGIFLLDTMNQDPASVKPGVLSAESGKRCGENLIKALELAKDRVLDGVVYAPLNKEALHRGGYAFYDELHFFASQLNRTEGFSELNVMDDLWVARVTSHIPLAKVSERITKDRVGSMIRFARDTLINIGIPNPRLAVAALNPHAGEGGLFGNEELDHIIPAIEDATAKGWNVSGPYPADTIFLRLEKERYDCIVGMYHDQIQTGMKMLGFNRGVTVSGGLPVVLTTPAHGTAFDIAGAGTADPGAMKSAMEVAVKLAKAHN